MRIRHVIDAKNRYERTVKAAVKNDEAVDSSTRTESSSMNVDVFGQSFRSAHSAHLLPYALTCSSYWFPVDPWVLCTGDENLSWNIKQKCIHGLNAEKQKGFLQRLSCVLKKGQTIVKKKSKVTKHKGHGSKESGKSRIQNVGIKHFPTNQIRLSAQETYSRMVARLCDSKETTNCGSRYQSE